MDAKGWPLRRVGLKVLDLLGEVAYYERLGLRLLESDEDRALLDPDGIRLELVD